MIFDGLSFFRDFNIKYYTQSKNASQGWVSLRCPFHSDHSDHFGFNPSFGSFSCWRCGKKSALQTVQAFTGFSKTASMGVYRKYLVNSYKGGMSYDRKRASGTQIDLPGNDFTRSERKYMAKRGISTEQIQSYDLRSGSIAGGWAYRVVLPIYFNGIIVSATGRAIHGEMEPKYWTLPLQEEIVHHKHIFYGMDLAGDTAVVVEGPIDALKGGPGIIASFGVNLTDEQLCLLLGYKSVIFLRDADEAGEKFTETAYKLSSLGGENIEVISMDNGYKDVGEMPNDEILGLRKELGL